MTNFSRPRSLQLLAYIDPLDEKENNLKISAKRLDVTKKQRYALWCVRGLMNFEGGERPCKMGYYRP